MINTDYLKSTIEEKLPDSQVMVFDLTGTSDHFQVQVISQEFEGKSALQRHRMVYALFGEDVGAAIHALSIKAMTPEEASGTPSQ